MGKNKFYAIFDEQTGGYMSTGLNTLSKEEAINEWLSYQKKSDMGNAEFKKLANKDITQIEEVMNSLEFFIDTDNTPFKEETTYIHFI